MSEIDPTMLAEVLAEIEAEQGDQEKYTVPLEELFWRLVEKGYEPSPEDLAEMQAQRPS